MDAEGSTTGTQCLHVEALWGPTRSIADTSCQVAVNLARFLTRIGETVTIHKVLASGEQKRGRKGRLIEPLLVKGSMSLFFAILLLHNVD